jgi:hypothetical protein
MDCEKVRDRFSSLWEKELVPSEEKIIREHLSSCPGCQKELERFGKTMEWLCTVEDVEVPEGFLPELYKKIEERKTAFLAGKSRGRWFFLPHSFKLPAQAIAMAGIVFLVLYLTKMMPMEVPRQKGAEQTSSPLSEERRSEQLFAQKKTENERGTIEMTAETTRRKDIEHLQAPASGKKEIEGIRDAQTKKEAKKEEVPVPKSEMMASQQIDSKEAAGARIPTPEPGKFEKELPAKEKPVLASKPSREMTLRIADREKAIFQLQELVKHFRGEMVAEEENRFVVSLPTISFQEFEKKLRELSASTQTDEVMAKKPSTFSVRTSPEVKREEEGGRSKEPVKLTADQEGRTVVLILLTKE